MTFVGEKEMKQKFKTQISELDGNRGKLKEKCQRLQKELDDRQASLQSAEVFSIEFHLFVTVILFLSNMVFNII